MSRELLGTDLFKETQIGEGTHAKVFSGTYRGESCY